MEPDQRSTVVARLPVSLATIVTSTDCHPPFVIPLSEPARNARDSDSLSGLVTSMMRSSAPNSVAALGTSVSPKWAIETTSVPRDERLDPIISGRTVGTHVFKMGQTLEVGGGRWAVVTEDY